MKMGIPNVQTIYIDSRNAAGLTQPVIEAVAQAEKVIAAVYLSPQGGAPTNRIVLQNASAALLENVLRNAADKTAVIAMGNPYVAAQFPEVKTYVCTFSDAQVSELSAAKAIFGEIPMSGRLPVTIPNVAKRGAGLGGPSPVSSGGSQ